MSLNGGKGWAMWAPKEVKCQFEHISREIMNKLSKCENEKTKNIVLSGNQFCRDVCFSKCNFLLNLAYL